MKSYSSRLALIVFVGVCFCGLAFGMPGVDAMPGLDDTTVIPVDSGATGTGVVSSAPLDQQVMADLSTLGGQSIKVYLSQLSSILNYVGAEFVSPEVQLAYSNAVIRFDKYARRAIRPGASFKDKSKLAATKKQIYEIDKFLKNLQSSPLFHSSAASYVTSAIGFWDNQTKKCGLSPYQKAIQRQKSMKAQRR